MRTKTAFFLDASSQDNRNTAGRVAKTGFRLTTMARIYINDNGQIRDFEDVEFAEKIVELKNKKDPWIVIDELLKHWAKKAPDEVEAIEVNVTEYKEALKDKVYGQTLGGKDQERRFKLSFPASLQLMIRTQYKADELPFDQAFYTKFATRYPFFKVAEK